MKEYLTPMGPTPLHVNPIFEIGPVEPRFSEWLVFEGISVDETGRQHYLDATVAYKRAVLNAIDYLFKFGYSKEQVPTFLSHSIKTVFERKITKETMVCTGIPLTLMLPMRRENIWDSRFSERSCYTCNTHFHL